MIMNESLTKDISPSQTEHSVKSINKMPQNIEAEQSLIGSILFDNKVLEDPQPSVDVEALADSSVNFAVRPWCMVEDYWNVYFGITENCKLALDKAGIEIPYPHSVEIHKQD